MRDHGDGNNIWAVLVKILRSKICNRELEIEGLVSISCPLANMPRFLQELEYCSGENAEILHNHLKQTKPKMNGLGIDLNSREAVMIVVPSFTGHLGYWAAHHADEIFKLGSIDELRR